jgi:hypothetical protein
LYPAFEAIATVVNTTLYVGSTRIASLEAMAVNSLSLSASIIDMMNEAAIVSNWLEVYLTPTDVARVSIKWLTAIDRSEGE